VVDLAVVRERLRAYHGTPLPLSVARFVVWLATDPSNVDELASAAYLMPAWDLAIGDPAAALPERPTHRYHSEPPEFISIARTGTDGEQVGLLELAPELERDALPFVTYFPMAFHEEICDLGTDFAGALAMYLAYPSVEGPRALKLTGFVEGVAPAAVWSGRAHTEVPPPGYRFEKTRDRTGVLAPSEAFNGDASTRAPLDVDERTLDAAVESAERALRDGYPATAIAVAREIRHICAGYYPGQFDRACSIWMSAALQLGRPWHAQMVAEMQSGAASGGEQTIRTADSVVFGWEP
jgi:hypothetical protein